MERYIDANAFQKVLYEVENEPDYQHEGEDWRCGVCLAGTRLDLFPTADVVEVVHAYWIEKRNDIVGRYFTCSNCGKDENHHTAITGRYCWFCGAKMDGGAANDRT